MTEQTATTPRTFDVVVSQTVRVTLDPAKFDDAFLAEFRASFFQFHTIEEHAAHLAQLHARGIADDVFHDFIEGYGPAKDMGIEFEIVDGEQEIVQGG